MRNFIVQLPWMEAFAAHNLMRNESVRKPPQGDHVCGISLVQFCRWAQRSFSLSFATAELAAANT
jgi:hypothetical protein